MVTKEYGNHEDHTGKKPRNYKSEYLHYSSSPEQIKRRDSRNKARAEMIKAGKAHVGDGKDVGHVSGNPMQDNPDLSNYKMETKHQNRSYKRDVHAHKVDPKS